ncbi:transcriptional regulator, XRE family [Dyadobacter sp. SG02]|uniref:helix-turn-helix domain-containing protein n=1 Tax=Dyadobacter sp. SG02 TaxID=1855291 RepID=UPI0008CE48EC|nr:helix-turn-helix transcriptional regulator [Dyadobacter sp. SG02]SEI80207.1 transcriptional regulator, XRE family [Dyadobacter sp. SG02]
MKKEAMKVYTLEELIDENVGERGTPRRDAFEHRLSMDLLGRMIRTVRKERNLTQEQLGELVGVQKAQISKLENGSNSATIDTILKVFRALKADVQFNITVDDRSISIPSARGSI